MIAPLEKPGTPEELVHFGIKGMKWGVRKETSISTSSSSSKKGMSTKKKIAVGAGIVVGAAAVGYILGRRGKIPISQIDGGKDNIIRLKNGKAAISTLTNKQWDAKIRDQQKYAQNLNMYSKMAKSQGLDFVRKNPASGLTRQEHLQMIDALNRMGHLRVYR